MCLTLTTKGKMIAYMNIYIFSKHMGLKCILVLLPENNPSVQNGKENEPITIIVTDGESLDFTY